MTIGVLVWFPLPGIIVNANQGAKKTTLTGINHYSSIINFYV